MVDEIIEADVVRVNRILVNVLTGTFMTAKHWDSWAKHFALNYTTWEIVPKFTEIAPSLSDSALLKSVGKFILVCESAKEKDPELNEMKSDIALNAFEILAQEVVNSAAAKSHNWDEKESLFNMISISNLREIMAQLAKEAEKFEDHQMAMPGVTAIESPPVNWLVKTWRKITSIFG